MFLVGSGRSSYKEVIAAHHNVAAFKSSGSLDVFDLVFREELTDSVDDLILFAVSGFSSGVGDDSACSGDESGVLYEAGVRISLVLGKDGDINTAS